VAAEISELSLSAKIASSAFVINSAPLNNRSHTRFEVPTTVRIKIEVSYDVTPCRLVKRGQRLEVFQRQFTSIYGVSAREHVHPQNKPP
jgi:hypothetical protein